MPHCSLTCAWCLCAHRPLPLLLLQLLPDDHMQRRIVCVATGTGALNFGHVG